ncbi:MAG: hypothetical protein B7Y12_18120 [Rhizobiales bacterium 24-66-13]|jgi:signal transduction histidine kinase|nr:MAG: hypothetical protein B7Y12_18120 [Rhizobiales bacterium 24-66-13]OZB08421.1 MAG: hypothetical protein B7X67_08140 [Rhizobiales bacterium 39-66-18]
MQLATIISLPSRVGAPGARPRPAPDQFPSLVPGTPRLHPHHHLGGKAHHVGAQSVAEPLEPVDLNGLLADLAAELSASGPPVTLVVSRPHILPLRRMALRRALRNLLENAQRYGAGATVGISHAGGETFVTIDDAGAGIPEADLERVFDPFERLETSRSRETGGAGLGLPIARAILRAHGGEVNLSNRPEGGLRATVRLPAANQGAKARVNASRKV